MNYWLIVYLLSAAISAPILIAAEMRLTGRLYLSDVVRDLSISLIPIANIYCVLVVLLQDFGQVVIWEKTK